MKSVTIYTGPLCNYCEAAKRLLTRNNVEYKEIDISTVDGAMDEMIKKANGKRTIHKFSLMINTLVAMMKQEL
jgi:glutaredoxin 3